MLKMQKMQNFNHHAKYEKSCLTNLIFADIVLLLCRGDAKSIEMIMDTFKVFSASSGLIMNPSKCKMYFGGVDYETKVKMRGIAELEEGVLPVRYLGVPLTSRKLTINHYMPMVEKIIGRFNHWATKIFSYVERIQLVKSISYAIAQYWMKCFPILKFVINKIDRICRTFIWIRNHEASTKGPVAWKRMCTTKKQRGFGIINMIVCNCVAHMKFLWNMCRKADNMWVRRIPSYYLKDKHVLEYEGNNTNS